MRKPLRSGVRAGGAVTSAVDFGGMSTRATKKTINSQIFQTFFRTLHWESDIPFGNLETVRKKFLIDIGYANGTIIAPRV